ncbi:MAG: hypothetical protein E7577_04915 [Ruminococcaceae bacterium]|nr:hypothetical protein [Oscillospiraceae bacterium]
MKRLFKNKVLAFVIALMMIASTFPMGIFSVSATTVQGTAITDAAGFAAMTADGTYYLENDITITDTYQTEFKGTFNGNGKTITASAPIFNQVMNATIENFKVVSQDNAEVTLADGGGMVCNKAGGNTILRNITNTVSLKSTNSTSTTNHSLAGIVGDFVAGAEKSTVTIYGCVNEGNISANDTKGIAGGIVGGATHASGNYNVIVENCSNSGVISAMKCGGIVGLFDKLTGSVTLKNCQNLGNVDAKKDLAGGIVSQVTANISNLKIENCVNSGDVSIAAVKYVGGMIGYCQMSGNTSKVQISRCYNSGDINAPTDKDTGALAGGIGGRVKGGLIEYCGNSGAISGGGYTAGIVARNSDNARIIRYCYNVGNVSSAMEVESKDVGYCAGILAFGSADEIYGCYNKGEIEGSTTSKAVAQIATTDSNNYHDNYYLDGMDVFAYKTKNDGAVKYEVADLASGKLAYVMNTAIGKTVYYQNIGISDVEDDDQPVLDATHAIVIPATNSENNKYYSLRFHTLETASIRLSANKAERGIRFATAVNKADYDNLPADVKESISFGTLITPDSYLKVVQGGGYEFTKSGLEKLDTDKPYMSIETSEFIEELKGADNSTYYYFCGSITGIKADNYQWDYSAIGYISIGEIEIYSTEYATRNIAYVANAALNDPEGGYTEEEINMIRGYLPQD